MGMSLAYTTRVIILPDPIVVEKESNFFPMSNITTVLFRLSLSLCLVSVSAPHCSAGGGGGKVAMFCWIVIEKLELQKKCVTGFF
jgi:hypothetical protein